MTETNNFMAIHFSSPAAEDMLRFKWDLKYPIWLSMASMVIIFRMISMGCVKTGNIDTPWISLTHLVKHLAHSKHLVQNFNRHTSYISFLN